MNTQFTRDEIELVVVNAMFAVNGIVASTTPTYSVCIASDAFDIAESMVLKMREYKASDE